jgi:beta-glucosidase
MILDHCITALWSVVFIIHASAQDPINGSVIFSDTFFYGQSPPFYPTPQASGIGGWTQYVDQARALVSQMTLEEKVSMTGGVAQVNNSCGGFIPPISRLNFPGMCLADGPAGVRAAELVNGYASGIHAGAR